MNWLFDNPLSEAPGPVFLAIYAGVITFLVVDTVWRKKRADRSLDLGPQPIPSKPDPVEIAFLRGGENEVTRLLVFDLIRRGYLRVEETSKRVGKGTETRILRADEPPDVARLTPIEADVFDFFSLSMKPENLFQPGGLAGRIKGGTSAMTESLRDQSLVSGPSQVNAAWRNWLGGSLMILAFGGFKFAIALAKGKHNVAFLVLMGIVGLVILAFASRVPRLTARGKDYLQRLREAFEGLKPRLAETSEGESFDPAYVLVPAVFGVAALAGTPYAYAPNLFKASAQTSGSCGGGCGMAAAGCGGGGGGGGGCGGGGCGGGGCGGCGGG